MRAKTKRQKLGNSPYLSEEHQLQPEYNSSLAFHKKNKLDKSIYSPQDIHTLIDYEAENNQLKQLIEAIKEQCAMKEADLNKQKGQFSREKREFQREKAGLKKQIEGLKQALQQKSFQIYELQTKIADFESQASKKNQNLMDKIVQCSQIIKQLEHQQLRSSTHNMLTTSRISKFNLDQSTIPANPLQSHQCTNLNNQLPSIQIQNTAMIQLSNTILMQIRKDNLPDQQNSVTTVKNNETSQKNLFYEDKRGEIQGSIPKRAQSPGVVFNYTGQKVVTPLTPVYIPQRNILQVNAALNNSKNAFIHNHKQQLSQNFTPQNHSFGMTFNNHPNHNRYANTQGNNGYENSIRRAVSPQNILVASNSSGLRNNFHK